MGGLILQWYIPLKICLKTIHAISPCRNINGFGQYDLSKDSDIAPLTLGSLENITYFYFTEETYFSKDLGEIYI